MKEQNESQQAQQVLLANATWEELYQLRKVATNMLTLINQIEDRGALTMEINPPAAAIAEP